MGAPYTSVSVTGYNANPPPDDGTNSAANTIFWATIKTKLADTLNTAIAAINTNNLAAFAKIIGGAGVSSSATDYQVQGTDQGKLVRATASAITITTPDATAVLSPFVFAVLNNSSGTITLDGSGSQTIDGNANIVLPAGGGTLLFTDGTNWFTTGIQGTLVGKQLSAGDIINGTIQESNGANAVTFSLKTLAGNDPSANDPVLLCFRNTTVGTGNYVYRAVTAALSLVISSGSTMGFSSGVAGKLWIVLFDDAGTIRMGAINCVTGGASPTAIYPLGQNPIASSTAEGGAGASDSAGVFYTGTAVTAKSYLILASCSYESGIATAGSWNASPTRIQLFGRGVPLPGAVIQSAYATATTATTVTTTTKTQTNTQVSIAPTSATSLIRVRAAGMAQQGAGGTTTMAIQLSRGTSPTLFGTLTGQGSNQFDGSVSVDGIDAPGTTSSTTYSVYIWNATGSGTSQWIGTLASLASQSTITAEEIVV